MPTRNLLYLSLIHISTDEVSQVIQCERGYYIIKCTNTLDREETDANKLKDVYKRQRWYRSADRYKT